MTDIDMITMFCAGPPDTPHSRRELRRYARQEADPPQWWQMPATTALVMENAPGAFAPATWPRVANRFTLRCRDCGLDVKRTLDRRYDHDYPPLSAVLETLRTNGIGEVSARSLDGVVAWTRPPRTDNR
jgi:hypothetical protein